MNGKEVLGYLERKAADTIGINNLGDIYRYIFLVSVDGNSVKAGVMTAGHVSTMFLLPSLNSLVRGDISRQSVVYAGLMLDIAVDFATLFLLTRGNPVGAVSGKLNYNLALSFIPDVLRSIKRFRGSHINPAQ